MTHARLPGSATLATLETQVEIDAPPEVVWDILARPDRLAEWDVALIRVGRISGRRDVAGASWWELRRLGRLPVWARWRVVAVEPGHRLDCLGRLPFGGRATMTEVVEAHDGRTTRRMRMTRRLPLAGLGRWLDRHLVADRLEATAEQGGRNLRRLAEGASRADPRPPIGPHGT